MRLLFIGDVVGKSGRNKVKERCKAIRKDYNIDYVICNAENSAHGKGITKKIYYDLLANGIDFITLGNHAFSKSEIKLEFNNLDKMIRPGNIANATVGEFYKIVTIKEKKVCIINLLGQSFMDVCIKSPFEMMDELLENVKADIYIVDFHGETTGEKMAFAYHYQDRIQMVIGTHTHVQTADNRIIGKCAFISDVGMCGPYESILGRDKDEVIEKFYGISSRKYTVAENEATFCAVVVEIDDKSNKAISIERIYELPL